MHRRMGDWRNKVVNSAANAARKCTRVVTKHQSRATPKPQPPTDPKAEWLSIIRQERLRKCREYIVPPQDIIVMSMHGMDLNLNRPR